MRMQARLARLWLGLLVLPLGLTIGGCGGGKGTVSGKVTYQGKTVPAGTIQILPTAGGSYLGEIEEDGTYKIINVPPGKANVVVETESVKPSRAAGPPGAKAGGDIYKDMPKGPPGAGPNQIAAFKTQKERTYVPIPPEYGDRGRPKLELTVKSGPNPFDINLK